MNNGYFSETCVHYIHDYSLFSIIILLSIEALAILNFLGWTQILGGKTIQIDTLADI